MVKDEIALNDFLKDFDRTEVIYLSAGSGFFFIGTVGEWFRDYLFIEKDDNCKTIYERAQRHLISPPRGVRRATYIREKERSWQNANYSYDITVKALEEYEPFSKRKVIDSYRRRMVEPLGQIVKITGISKDQFWFMGDTGKEEEE